MNPVDTVFPIDAAAWKTLFRIAGVAALVMVVFIPVQMAVFIEWPPPNTVIGWFELFQNSHLVGLVDMDLLLMVDQIIMGIIFVSLFAALRWTDPSLMTVSALLGLSGMIMYFSSAVAFQMMSLSDMYAAAATSAERNAIVAAGQTMIVTWQGTAFNFAYVSQAVALLLAAIVMLRSTVFGRNTAVVGIILGVASLIPPTVPTIGMYFAIGSLVPLVTWDVLVARDFFKLAGTPAAGHRRPVP